LERESQEWPAIAGCSLMRVRVEVVGSKLKRYRLGWLNEPTRKSILGIGFQLIRMKILRLCLFGGGAERLALLI
jgi:hypothetical protein